MIAAATPTVMSKKRYASASLLSGCFIYRMYTVVKTMTHITSTKCQ